MLTRLKVAGFKNLVDLDVRFGPFTCVAGVNGVGKSNLFDAIRFLSALSCRPLTEAALSVRGEGGGASDLRGLFHRAAERSVARMSFEAEMIVPAEVVDDLGQTCRATNTMLRYSLELGRRQDSRNALLGPLEILREELEHINQADAARRLLFPHSRKRWRTEVVAGARRVPYISTLGAGGDDVRIELHQDAGSGGRYCVSAARLPRTVLSAANASDSPTVLCARREMMSWRLLQLEPSALRAPDEMNASPHIEADGRRLPATLHHLAQSWTPDDADESGPAPGEFYAQVAERLRGLGADLGGIRVDRDEARELLTLRATGADGADYSARSLSAGMLRLLALVVLELDAARPGVLCIEEPENGIHPERIPALLQLLRDMAADPHEAPGLTNPLRQVIVNTHSPAVVREVPDASLLVAETRAEERHDQAVEKLVLTCLADTWRTKAAEQPPLVREETLSAYLNPAWSAGNADDGRAVQGREGTPPASRRARKSVRVADRNDLQLMMPWGE